MGDIFNPPFLTGCLDFVDIVYQYSSPINAGIIPGESNLLAISLKRIGQIVDLEILEG